MAAIMALEHLPGSRRFIIHVDSEYVQNNAMRHLPEWKHNAWWTAKNKGVVNRDLWERLDAAASRHDMQWRWVSAHGHDDMDNRADTLATRAREDQKGKPETVRVRRIGLAKAHSPVAAVGGQD